MNMKSNLLILTAAASALALTGCQYPNGDPNYTGTGALTGGAVGAASGAALGGHEAGEGALIGGAIGAIAGGIIGSGMDAQQRERLQQQAPQTYARVDQGQPLQLADIKAMARSGVSDDVIISQIRNTHSAYRLTAADIIDLHNSGVSDRVVNFMINTPGLSEAAPSTTLVVQQPPPPPPAETYVVAPGPGYVWIGGEYIWNGGWVWVGGHWGYPPAPHAVWVTGGWYHGPRGYYHSPGHWRH
jgi:hypothetical protein